VTIPVKLYSATEERDVQFNHVHVEDGGRIRYKRICEIDGKEVEYADIAKGYQLSNGEVVVLTDEDFKDLPLTTSRAIDVLEFVPLEQVDPIFFAKSYYLEPEKPGVKPYVLLREALEQSGRVALVKVALRQREQLATLRVKDGVFVLETMLWPDEIRTPDFGFLDDKVDVRPQEVHMAGALIDSLSADFDPSQYGDAYREALNEMIEAKVAGREVVQPTEAPAEGGAVVDLMSALRASVEAAKAKKDGGSPAAAGAGAGAIAKSSSKPKKATAAKAARAAPKKSAAAAKPARKAARKSA
jgi:DNA end-binding protein Ku